MEVADVGRDVSEDSVESGDPSFPLPGGLQKDCGPPREHSVYFPVEASTPSAWARNGTVRPPTGCRIPFSFTLALSGAITICLVGFLAWAVPFTNLTATINPLADAIRSLLLTKVTAELQSQWQQIRQQTITQRKLWDTFGQPGFPLDDPVTMGRMFQPLIESNTAIVGAPFIMEVGPCIQMANLNSAPTWNMNLQNCTHRWQEGWDPVAQNLTGEFMGFIPMLGMESGNLVAPMNLTTPSQPFNWIQVFNPRAGLGNVFSAAVGLFNATTNAFIGRFSISISTANLNAFLSDQIASQVELDGARLALFDSNHQVVASSNGRYSPSVMYNLTDIGDPDLEAAGAFLQTLPGGWCVNRSMEVQFSERYFLDTTLCTDPYPSPSKLQWCVLLLTPRRNTLAAVEESLTFAVVFVCCMTLSVTAIAVGLGFLVARPLQRLTTGICALQETDIETARIYASDRSRFTELFRAQRSYSTLVDAIDAFGKYVPKAVVRGLLAGGIRPELGMAEQHLAVGFMDVEDFTNLCEGTKVTEMVAATSRLFDMCCDHIAQSHGTIDKFIGDCIMVFWGAPAPVRHPGLNAAQAVYHILTHLEEQPVCLGDGTRLQLRVGLHFGRCLVGNFGASGRWDYTVMGDVVNAASRLEALNKQFRTRCLISGAIRDQVLDNQHITTRLRSMGDVLLLGKRVPLPVYELSAAPVRGAAGWADAVATFQRGPLRTAAAYFTGLPDDAAAQALGQEVLDTAAAGPFVRYMRAK